jgi:hypothetical protein
MALPSDQFLNIQSVTNTKGNSDLFITNDNKYSIEFSKIEEYGMMKFVSPVEVWAGIENSILLFRSSKIKFEYQFSQSCYYLDKSDIIVLLTPCIHQDYVNLLYVLFDFNKNIFTTINAPNFLLTEITKSLVRLDLHFRYIYADEIKKKISQDNGKQIDLKSLIWNDIKSIDKVCSLTTKTITR